MPGTLAAPVPFALQRLPDRWFVPLVSGLPSERVAAPSAYSTRSIVPPFRDGSVHCFQRLHYRVDTG